MIHLPVSAQVAKTEILRREAGVGRTRLDPAPIRTGRILRLRRSLGRLLIAAGDRLDDSRSWRPAPAGDPCG